jgi:hypothetical protein
MKHSKPDSWRPDLWQDEVPASRRKLHKLANQPFTFLVLVCIFLLLVFYLVNDFI